MRSRHLRCAVVLATAVSLVSGQFVFAHGGGGGGGGGHGGGGGGHGGGFGGGHGGGFGGGGFGGGGYHGGGSHMGGYYGGMGGYHGGGLSGAGMGTHNFSSPSHGAPSMSGRMSGSNNLGGNVGRGVSGTSHVGANSHLHQSIISNGAHGTGLNNAGRAAHIGQLTGLTGRNGAQGLNGTHHQSQFLANHGVHNTGFRGTNMHNVNNNMGHNNWNHNGNFNHRNNFFSPFFFGGFWPWWGYGYGYGYGNRYWRNGFWGYPFGYGFGYPFLGLWGLYGGYGYGGYGGGGGYGYGYPYYAYNPYCTYGYGMYGTDELAGANQPAVNQQAADQVGEFAAVGETDFKAGNYDAAVRDWRHALLDDPNNGTLVMMLGQALFANGKFDEAAGAVQQAMTLLPDAQWGVVVSNYTELYPKIGDYTNQLRALEKAVSDQPDSPGLRFLVGYHYGYLGYPQDAIKQLAKAKALAPQDEMAKRLFAVFEAKAGNGDGKPAGKKAEADLPPQAKADLPKF